MLSRGFYSFYVLVLLVFIGMGVWGFYTWKGRGEDFKIQEHLRIQLGIYAKNLSNFGKICLSQYSLDTCKNLSFDFEGYQAHFTLSSCKKDLCVMDLSIEVISPLNSQLLRYTQRAIWDLKNLKKGAAHRKDIDKK